MSDISGRATNWRRGVMVAPPDDSIPEGAVRKPPLPPVRGTSHHLKDGAYVFESTVQQPTLCCLADHTHSGGRFQTCPHPHPPPWRANAPNDGFHPRTAPYGPAARAPRRNAHPFTRCCRADHTRHRMHRGGRFQTCPLYGVLMRQTMGSNRALYNAGQRPAHPGA